MMATRPSMEDHNLDTNFLPKNESPYYGYRGDFPPSTSHASVANTNESASVLSWGLNSIASPYPYGGNSVVSAAPAGIRYTTSTTLTPGSTAHSPSPPASSFYDPNNWYTEYKQLNTGALKKEDYVAWSSSERPRSQSCANYQPATPSWLRGTPSRSRSTLRRM